MKKRDRSIRPEQLADTLQVEPSAIDQWVEAGWLKAFKLPSGELRIDPRSVQDFLLACELDVRSHFVNVVVP